MGVSNIEPLEFGKVCFLWNSLKLQRDKSVCVVVEVSIGKTVSLSLTKTERLSNGLSYFRENILCVISIGLISGRHIGSVVLDVLATSVV